MTGSVTDVLKGNLTLSPQASDVGIRAIRLLVDLACADFEQHKTENRFFEDHYRILRWLRLPIV